MEIRDLTPDEEPLFFKCLEDWSTEMDDAGDHKERWYRAMSGRGLRVKVAADERGTVGGMIQYLPIEHTAAEGRNLYMVQCIWVHGYKQGRGNFQKKGMGKALLAAAEEDARALGADGLAVWGLVLPFFMRASWFRRHGYRPVDRDGISSLLWKPFREGAAAPRWVRLRKKPAAEPGVVSVEAFVNGWCPGMNMVFERAKRAVAELGGGDPAVPLRFREHRTDDPAVFAEWGLRDGLFVDGRAVRTGPPPSYEKIRGLLAARLKRLPRQG